MNTVRAATDHAYNINSFPLKCHDTLPATIPTNRNSNFGKPRTDLA